MDSKEQVVADKDRLSRSLHRSTHSLKQAEESIKVSISTSRHISMLPSQSTAANSSNCHYCKHEGMLGSCTVSM